MDETLQLRSETRSPAVAVARVCVWCNIFSHLFYAVELSLRFCGGKLLGLTSRLETLRKPVKLSLPWGTRALQAAGTIVFEGAHTRRQDTLGVRCRALVSDLLRLRTCRCMFFVMVGECL